MQTRHGHWLNLKTPDAVQIRDASGTYFMGLSYGNKEAGLIVVAAPLMQLIHPDYGTYGTNALYFLNYQ